MGECPFAENRRCDEDELRARVVELEAALRAYLDQMIAAKGYPLPGTWGEHFMKLLHPNAALQSKDVASR